MTNPPRITWRGGQLRAIKKKKIRPYLRATEADLEFKKAAKARIEVINYVLMCKHMRGVSLRQAILKIHQRIMVRDIPPHIATAVMTAHARPSRIGGVNISAKTLFRWVKIFNAAENNELALYPNSSKSIHANKNRPIKQN